MLIPSVIFTALVTPRRFHFIHNRQHTFPPSLVRFWEGRWKMKGTHPEGGFLVAHNQVKVLRQGKILQEDISLLDRPAIQGRGLSTFQQKTASWHHVYHDSEGRYLEFIGRADEEQQFFVTKVQCCHGRDKAQRIPLCTAQHAGYAWDWQELNPEYKAWRASWTIRYQKLHNP